MVRRARHNKQALQWHSNQETQLLRGQEPLDGNVGVTDLQPEYAVFDQESGLTCFVLALGSRLAHGAQQYREGTIVRMDAILLLAQF
jgi:hypothetical protein